ncbi:MAG TPA: hypothetical protein VFB06_10875 [Streptosporangiaceae bacterium]|nr:hypothetical protein [Streptosporangiaceae bacterium]
MRSRYTWVAAAGLALTAALTACSSSSSGTTGSGSTPSSSSMAPSSSAPSSAAAEPTSGSGAVSAITANWEAFFSGKTSAATKISLLQNGQTFGQIINNQAGSSLSSSAKATVSSVTVNSDGTATVKYSVGISGASLPPTNGTAVYQDGVWKVGDVSFCYLLTLENGGSKPSVCSSAG